MISRYGVKHKLLHCTLSTEYEVPDLGKSVPPYVIHDTVHFLVRHIGNPDRFVVLYRCQLRAKRANLLGSSVAIHGYTPVKLVAIH